MKSISYPKSIAALLLTVLAATNAAAEANDTPSSTGSQPELAYFSGTWQMKGRFRFAESQQWLATKSQLTARLALDGKTIVREIEAPQIGLKAIDTISVDPTSGVIQYLYQTNREPNALVFEGACSDDHCKELNMVRVCGPENQTACDSRTTISIESDNRFVARDYQNTDGQEYMSREVFYERD